MYAEKNTPDNERKQFNFPAAPRAIIAPAVVECIVPALADLIFETADALAEQECGESTTVFDVERMAGDLLHALADLLTLSPVPLRGVRDLLRFHQAARFRGCVLRLTWRYRWSLRTRIRTISSRGGAMSDQNASSLKTS